MAFPWLNKLLIETKDKPTDRITESANLILNLIAKAGYDI